MVGRDHDIYTDPDVGDYHRMLLPGTYSLTANSLEEVIARDYIIKQRPDVVVAVVDAAILERSLYLVVIDMRREQLIVLPVLHRVAHNITAAHLDVERKLLAMRVNALRQTRGQLGEKQIPFMGVLAAFIFAAPCVSIVSTTRIASPRRVAG